MNPRVCFVLTLLFCFTAGNYDSVKSVDGGEPAVPAPSGNAKAPDSSTTPAGVRRRRTTVELFVKSDCRQCAAATDFLERLGEQRDDVTVVVSNVEEDADALRRLHALCKEHKLPKAGLPGILACDRLLVGYRDDETTGKQVEDLLGVEVFSQDGCPHCASAKRFLDDLAARTPGLRITYRNIARDPQQHQRMQALAQKHQISSPSVPFISVVGKIQVGFERPETTGRQLQALVDKHFPLQEEEETVSRIEKSASALE